MANLVEGADTNPEGIAYGVDEIQNMGDLNLVEGQAHNDIPLVIKVNGTQVSSIGISGLVLTSDGYQDLFEINCTT
jgi:hypothetical protein